MTKKIYLLLLLLLLSFKSFSQTSGAHVLTGSAEPPLPFNIIPNPNFEDRTTGWSVSSGTFTATQTSANVARGRFSASWTVPASTSSGLLFQSQAITVPPGLYGRSCLAAILYKGNTATMGTMVIDAYDGTTIYGARALNNATTYTRIQTTVFTCPSTGTLRLRIRTTASTPASPAAVFFDEAALADYDSFGGTGGGAYVVNADTAYAAGGIISTGSDVRSISYVHGSGAAITLDTSTPLTNGTSDGQERAIIGTSDSNTVTIPNSGNMILNSSAVLTNGAAIDLVWRVSDSKWLEISRTNVQATLPLTTRGDLVTRNGASTNIRLALGAAGTVLRSDGTDPAWTAPVLVSAQNTAGTSITSSTATVPFATEYYDNNSAFASGVFTAPRNGFYRFNVTLETDAVSNSTAQSFDGYYKVTSTPMGFSAAVQNCAVVWGQGINHVHNLSCTKTYQLNTGDTVEFQADNSNTVGLNTNSGRNYISIESVN